MESFAIMKTSYDWQSSQQAIPAYGMSLILGKPNSAHTPKGSR